MSTILKALRRLEEERTLHQAGSLQQHVVRGPVERPRSSSRFKLLAIIASGLLSAVAGGLAFALWSTASMEGTPAVAAAPPAPMAAIAAVDPSPVPSPRAPAPAPMEVEVVEELPRWSDGEASEPATATASPAAQPRVMASRSPAPAREKEQSVDFADDVAVVTAISDDLKPGEIEPESPLAARVEEPLPRIRRAKLANVEVVQTVWHPSSSRRQAVLRVPGYDELLRVAEGDAVGTMVLLEIQPAGVVFDHEGIQIQRRVGDSRVGN